MQICHRWGHNFSFLSFPGTLNVIHTILYVGISCNNWLSVRCSIFARLTRRVKSSVSDPSTPLTSQYKALIFILLIVSAGYWPSHFDHKIHHLCNGVTNKASESDNSFHLSTLSSEAVKKITYINTTRNGLQYAHTSFVGINISCKLKLNNTICAILLISKSTLNLHSLKWRRRTGIPIINLRRSNNC